MASERIQRRLERLLDQIDEAESQGNWESVQALAQDILEIDSDNTEAVAYLRSADRRLGAMAATGSIQAESTLPSPPTITVRQTIHPTSFANGRYQVKEFLGEGGKKKVYSAHDSTLDRDVALAVIKAEGLDDASRARVTREARAMGRLGDHPNVLPIHDLGEENGQPYLILPLMAGGDLDHLMDNAKDRRLSMDLTIAIAIGVCLGLEYAHSRGVVHRDLKPGNIWFTEDGTAKIGDFGLAVVLDYSRLTTEGMLVGTVSYMPPEQAMGGDVTPRSDLYSLGAMLYEMVTGRPPFLGDDAVAIIGQHINTPPVSPSWHNAGCPRPLEALILRLLAKSPAERPESATDVLSALNAIDLSVPVEQRQEEEAPSLDSLAGGVFVGRQQEMGELKAALEDALSGRGRLVMLVGEPGIGKTRTAQELATYAGMRGAQVLWGRCYEEQGTPPFWPWVQAIRSHVRESDVERLRSEMGAGAVDIAEVVSDIRERLTGLQPAPVLEPDQARFRLFDSVTTFLKNAGQGQPLVLMLDDLHWADKPSLLLLEFLARELTGARLLVVGTYRDMEFSRQHPLSETLGGLNRERLFQRVLLRGLTEEDVARFIEVAAGIEPPAGLAAAVHTQTEGNPLFVTEVVRLLVQEGELTAEQSNSRESWTVRIPEGVKEVIWRRLNQLSQRCNETLTIASVIGREFELRQLAPLVEDMSEDRLLDVLEEALAARVIEEMPSAVGRYQFTHALIQETLAEELSTTRRVRLHARIAEALEALYGDDAGEHAAKLVDHYAQAQTVSGTEKLVHYSLLAGERALATYAYEDALAHFERGLVARDITLSGTKAASDEQAADLLFGLARAQAATAEVHQLVEAFAALSRAFEYYAEAGNLAQAVAAAEFQITTPAFPIPGLADLLTRALSLVPADSHEAGRLLSRYGGIIGVVDYDGGQHAMARAISIARREGDVTLEVQSLSRAATVSFGHLRWQESVDYGLRALELAARDEISASVFRWRAAISLLHMGDLEAASPHTLVLRERAEGRGKGRGNLRQSSGNSFVPITYLSCLEGDWKAGREYSGLGLDLSPLSPHLLLLRVLLEHETEESAQGEIYLERLLDTIRRAGPDRFLTSVFASMAMAIIARITGVSGRLEIADAAAKTVVSEQSVSPVAAMQAKAGLALLAVRDGNRSDAKEYYAYLLGQRGTMIYTVTSADRLLGLLSQIMGNMDQAGVHFEDAHAFCSKAGYRPELAWTCCDYSDMLRQRDAEGDQSRVMTLLDESLTISSELGMRPLMERVLARKLELQGVASVDIRTSIGAVASAVTIERPDLRPHTAPDGTVTILFSDIEGSTQMTERLGDQRMQQILRGHNDIVRHQVAAYGGFEVKSLGDGFMLAFSSARRALQCAISIQQAFAAHNREHPEEPVMVRIGLHTGEFVQEMEDFFGKNVILASRIADQAQGGQILVSGLLKELTDSAGDIQFGDVQEVELKGLTGLNRVYTVAWG